MIFQPEQLQGMDEHVRDYVQAIEYLLGKFGYLLLGAFLLAVFKDLVKQAVAGLIWKFGRRYNEDDVVMVENEPGRITRIGIFFTKVYIYDTVEHAPGQGWSRMIPSDRVPGMKILKPLPRHEPSGIYKPQTK